MTENTPAPFGRCHICDEPLSLEPITGSHVCPTHGRQDGYAEAVLYLVDTCHINEFDAREVLRLQSEGKRDLSRRGERARLTASPVAFAHEGDTVEILCIYGKVARVTTKLSGEPIKTVDTPLGTFYASEGGYFTVALDSLLPVDWYASVTEVLRDQHPECKVTHETNTGGGCQLVEAERPDGLYVVFTEDCVCLYTHEEWSEGDGQSLQYIDFGEGKTPEQAVETANDAEMFKHHATPEEVAECVTAMVAEIRADMQAGIVPATVGDFSTLHDYVDANCYGGFCDDGTAGTTRNPRSLWDIESIGAAQDAVDRLLADGEVSGGRMETIESAARYLLAAIEAFEAAGLADFHEEMPEDGEPECPPEDLLNPEAHAIGKYADALSAALDL